MNKRNMLKVIGTAAAIVVAVTSVVTPSYAQSKPKSEAKLNATTGDFQGSWLFGCSGGYNKPDAGYIQFNVQNQGTFVAPGASGTAKVNSGGGGGGGGGKNSSDGGGKNSSDGGIKFVRVY